MNEDTVVHFFGFISMIAQFAIVSVSKPHQIKEIYRNKSAKNISLPMFWLILLSCITYFIYGLLIADAYIWAPQIPAIVFVGIIIRLCYRYRSNPA